MSSAKKYMPICSKKRSILSYVLVGTFPPSNWALHRYKSSYFRILAIVWIILTFGIAWTMQLAPFLSPLSARISSTWTISSRIKYGKMPTGQWRGQLACLWAYRWCHIQATRKKFFTWWSNWNLRLVLGRSIKVRLANKIYDIRSLTSSFFVF